MANPFVAIGESLSTDTGNELPELKEWAWDFEHDTFRYDDKGHHITVTENEALKVWIYKALKTERYRFACYRHGIYDVDCNYGAELEQYIGQNPNDERTANKVIQAVKECLSVNPYIVSIDSVEVESRDKDRLTILVELTSVYGNVEMEVST